jgi:hypothetical protein
MSANPLQDLYIGRRPLKDYLLMHSLPGLYFPKIKYPENSGEQTSAWIEIFNQAKKYVFVISGDCCNIWEDENLIIAMSNAIGRRVKIAVLCDLSSSPRLPSEIKVFRGDSKKEHFIVNDASMVIVHNIGDKEGKVLLGSPFLRNRCARAFIHQCDKSLGLG